MMLKFVTTTLLALLIFLPACIMVSRFFRISEQAENSYDDFVAELYSFFNNADLEDAFVLKMDTETAIVGFTRNSPVYFDAQIRSWGGEISSSPSATISSEKYFAVPPQCTTFPCICLCQQFELGKKSTLTIDKVQLSREELSCKQLVCEPGSDFSLKNDFVILRGDQKTPRRVTVILTKEAGGVVVKT